MPEYELICGKCQHQWTIVKSMAAALPSKCPECKSKKVCRDYSKIRIYGVTKGKDRDQIERQVKQQLRHDLEKMKKDEGFAQNIIGDRANPLLRGNQESTKKEV